jgi:hypothetical protein
LPATFSRCCRAVLIADRVPDNLRRQCRDRQYRTRAASGWELYATALRALRLRSAYPARYSASCLMIPMDPDRSHSHRRTDNTELEAGLCCSAPAGAGRTDAEALYTGQQWADDSESLHRRRDKQSPAAPLCQHLHQTLLQTTPARPSTLCRPIVYDTVVLSRLLSDLP